MDVQAAATEGGIAASTRRYLAGLGALYRRDPVLAARVDATPFAQAPKLEAARDGNPTARLTADDGRKIYAHSRYQPVEEARKLIESQPPADPPTFMLFGMGLGYHVAELERLYDRPMVIVAEDDPGLLKAALSVHDFSAPIDAGRLVFLVSGAKGEFHEKLGACNADVMLGLRIITPPYAKRYHTEFHSRVREALPEFLDYARMQIVTLLKVARTTSKNVAFNMSRYVSAPGVEVLENRAAGYPAIVVAAGPSLARHLDALHKLRDSAVIIAVQTVYKLLRSMNLAPHFVTSLDFHEVSEDFFVGFDDPGDCTLVAEPKATWKVLDAFKGPVRVLHHDMYDALLRDAAPKRGALPGGTTVAHLAFYLAQHLGCDPVIFIGQDLAFSEGLFYMPGSPIEQTWQPELNRFGTIEMKQWERIVRNRPILRRTEDLQGKPIYTDDLLFSYAEQFQKDFASASCTVIQASESGLAPPGMKVMPLHAAAERYCTRPLPPELLSGAAVGTAHGPAKILRELRERIVELEDVRRISAEMRGLLTRLSDLTDKPTEFNRLIVRVDDLRTTMHKHARLYKLIVDLSTSAELRRYSADRRIGRPEQETREIAQQRLQRDREFVDAFLDGCKFLAKVLDDALARAEQQLQ